MPMILFEVTFALYTENWKVFATRMMVFTTSQVMEWQEKGGDQKLPMRGFLI